MPKSARKPSPKACAWASKYSRPSRRPLKEAGTIPTSALTGLALPRISHRPMLLWKNFVMKAIERLVTNQVKISALALDCAATEFFKNGVYDYVGEGKKRSKDEQAKYLADLVSRYPIVSIEDGMSEDDFDGWKALTDLAGKKCQLVGDDLFVTNVNRLSDGIKRGLGNSILVKVNQIGSLTETLAAVEMAHKAAYTAVMSHRSGETERFYHRRPRRRHKLRADQDGFAGAFGPDVQIQPASAHRGRTRAAGEVRSAGRRLRVSR